MEFAVDVLALLFVVALVAGIIDAIAGGGGLLTVPALMAVGIPPAMALGTNKLQGCFGSMSASLHFVRHKMVDLRRFWPPIIASGVGGAFGSLAVQSIDPSFLKQVIPWLLIAIALYMLLAPRAGDVERHQRVSMPVFAFTVGFGVGFYDGFFGPGTGTFFAIGCVAVLGTTLPVATAHSKLMNFACNSVALVFFIIGGKVLWLPGGVMAVGQIIGGQIGARLVFRGGAKLVRRVLVVVSIAISIRLFMTS